MRARIKTFLEFGVILGLLLLITCLCSPHEDAPTSTGGLPDPHPVVVEHGDGCGCSVCWSRRERERLSGQQRTPGSR